MKINLNSVLVADQAQALAFYTEILGFQKKADIPLGEHRWLTVVSTSDPDGTELLLEPMGFAPAGIYQKALFEAGIPQTAFEVDDIQETFDQLTALGVVFTTPPTDAGGATIAVLDDTCGNLIQIYQT